MSPEIAKALLLKIYEWQARDPGGQVKVRMIKVLSGTPDDVRKHRNVKDTHVGYSAEIPHVGHPMVIFYELDGHARYVRTTPVRRIVADDGNAVLGSWIVETINSTYIVDELDVETVVEVA